MSKLEIVKALYRPLIGYLGGIAVAVGLFVPFVPADKLWVAAALTGVIGATRTIDKISAKPEPKP